MAITLKELSYFAKSKEDLYYGLSATYYLPKLKCKAVTLGYLLEISKADSKFLKVPREEVHPMALEFKKIGIADIIEQLDKHLIRKGYKPTGFDLCHLPDAKWISVICKWADPNDELQIFKKRIPMEATLKREIDPK